MSVTEADPAEVLLRVSQSLFVVFAAILAASLVISPAETVASALGLDSGGPEVATLRTVAQFVGFTLACVAFLYYADERDLIGVRRPTGREALLIAGGVIGLLIVQFGLLLGLDQLGITTGENQAITAGERAPIYFLYMVPVSILVVGPAEELLFRGIVQGEVKRAVGAPAGIGFAAVVFGAIHYSGVSGTTAERAAYVLVAALLGVLLGVLYEETGNVTVPALAHGGYNAVLFAIQYLSVVGALGVS